MCGLLGFVSGNGGLAERQNFESALTQLTHRGPDDRGTATYHLPHRTVSLGHTRLSIIDLSDSGHQPMTSQDDRYTLVFNGEIYNYIELQRELEAQGVVFRSNSDTEVLLNAWVAWGERALRKIIGMFAFAIFDRKSQQLVLARDGFGIKPLFWSVENDQLAFASELGPLRSLRNGGGEPNNAVLARYLIAGSFDVGSESFLEGVHSLEPGCCLSVDLSDMSLAPRISRWWIPSIVQSGPRSIEESADMIRELFLESVRLHLRSDVPLGFALSGGIDSSAVVSAVRRIEPEMELKTFSFVAPGTNVNEEKWIDIVNSHVGGTPHKVEVGSRDLASDLDDMIRAQGEPFGGTSIYAQYAVYREAKRAGITVTMDGQGADELFAGYHGYIERRLLSLIDELNFGEVFQTLSAWSDWPGRDGKVALRSVIAAKLPGGLYRFIRGRRRRKSEGFSRAWINREAWTSVNWGQEMNPEERGRRLVGALRGELTQGGLGSRLRNGDRNSMRWSIESRVPFLTIPLAEAALSLPENHLLSSSGETKHVFRKAMRGIVPREVLDRRDKVGFDTPEREWLRELSGIIEAEWLDGLEKLAIVNSKLARKAVVDQLKQGEITPEAWRLINCSRWAMLFL